MRRKVVTFDGAAFTIAALSMTQVKEYLKNYGSVDMKDEATAIKVNAELICMSLNRAVQKADIPSDADAKIFTPETLPDMMDYPLYFELLPTAIREFSGLKLTIVPRETPKATDAKPSDQPGEAPATSVN